MLTIEYRETDETIQLLVYRDRQLSETFYLDADDTNWELTIDDNGLTTEFRINGSDAHDPINDARLILDTDTDNESD